MHNGFPSCWCEIEHSRLLDSGPLGRSNSMRSETGYKVRMGFEEAVGLKSGWAAELALYMAELPQQPYGSRRAQQVPEPWNRSDGSNRRENSACRSCLPTMTPPRQALRRKTRNGYDRPRRRAAHEADAD